MAALSAALLAAQTAGSFFGQRNQATAAVNQGNYTQTIDNQNATIADRQAADSITRGQLSESQSRTGTRQNVGADRVAAAAGGTDAGTGSNATIQGQTGELGAMDALMIRTNAARQAWGFTTEASNYRAQGAAAAMAGQNTAAGYRAGAWGTLLTGAAQGAGMWKRNQMNTPTDSTAPTDTTPRTKPRAGSRVSY